MIAAAYIRVSTEDQTEFSPDSQLKRILEYASSHNIQVPEEYIFIDEGISGRSASRRPAFQNMIALAKSRQPFQQILVWKFSRFARNRQDSIFYKSMLRKDCGIEVVSITEPLSHDPTSILIEALLEAMDEYYSINLAQEVRRGMQERFSRGKAISIPPFGYQMGLEGFEVHPEQAPWIPLIFKEFTAGKTPREIAGQLNTAGVRTTRGNCFQPRNIAYILLNPVYIGKLRKRYTSSNASYNTFSVSASFPHNDRNYAYTKMELIDGNHPALVDMTLWQKAQELWYKESRIKREEYNSSEISESMEALCQNRILFSCYFLKGLVFCGNCGNPLVHIHQGNAFQCGHYNHGLCHVSHYIRTERLEALVLEQLSKVLPPESLLYLQKSTLSSYEKNRILHCIPYKIVYDKEEKQIKLVSK